MKPKSSQGIESPKYSSTSEQAQSVRSGEVEIPQHTPEAGTGARANLGDGTLSPLNLLLKYQRNWVDDPARFKLGIMSRQVGKDFSAAGEGVTDIQRVETAGLKTDWLIGAPSERQSLESLNKWKEWTEAYKLAIEDVIEEREGGSEALLKSATILYPNGSRVVAVPGRPATVRGMSANVLLTEFAFFEQPDETLRAVLPSITNPLRGGLKKIRLITTPNGAGNKTHELWTQNYQVPGARWSCHKVTIHDAVSMGLPVDAEELREALNDPEGWAQEYECEFIDAAGVLLDYALIATCESSMASYSMPPEYWEVVAGQFPIDLGIDFGRKKDLTCCYAAEKVGEMQVTKEVLELKGLSTPRQVEILSPRIARCRRAALDYTGPGVGLGDYLVEKFGEWDPERDKFGKIELCTFTQSLKQDIFPKLKMAFESKRILIPSNRLLREDLHSVYRIVSPNGGVTYGAPHTPDGHSDRATAAALCVRAGSGAVLGSFHAIPSREGTFAASRHERVVVA